MRTTIDRHPVVRRHNGTILVEFVADGQTHIFRMSQRQALFLAADIAYQQSKSEEQEGCRENAATLDECEQALNAIGGPR